MFFRNWKDETKREYNILQNRIILCMLFIFVSHCLLLPPMPFYFCIKLFSFLYCRISFYDLLWTFCIVYQILFIFVSLRRLLWPPAIPCLRILKAISSWQKWCSTETSWVWILKIMLRNNISNLQVSYLQFSGWFHSSFKNTNTK